MAFSMLGAPTCQLQVVDQNVLGHEEQLTGAPADKVAHVVHVELVAAIVGEECVLVATPGAPVDILQTRPQSLSASGKTQLQSKACSVHEHACRYH